MFSTEYPFTLPKGYIDTEGNVHKDGIMRLATAADEILPMKDPRVQSNETYLIIILMSRVITKLGTLQSINPKVIENVFKEDLAYLQELYNRINGGDKISMAVSCPKCAHDFNVDLTARGGL